MPSIYDPDCHRCPLSERPRHDGLAVCVPASGPDDADIIFFGEAPGEAEEQQNTPFVGPAGGELDRLMARAKLKRARVRVSNTVRCRPDGNATPKKNEVDACAYYTVREIATVRPKVIVALGGSALKALTGQDKVGANRGKLLSLLPVYRSAVRVLATYHPAAYLHNPGMRDAYSLAIVEDMRLAKKVAKDDALDARIVTPFDGAEAMDAALDKLANASRIAVDLEWEVIPARRGLPEGKWPWSHRNGRAPRPVSVAVAARTDAGLCGVAAPLQKAPWARPAWRKAIRRLIATVPSFGHLYMADLVWMYGMGWRVRRVAGCTITLASLLNIEGSKALDALAGRLTDMPATWKVGEQRGDVPNTDGAWEEKLIYNARDAVATVLTLEAEERLVTRKRREAVLPLYERVLLPATDILAQATVAGVPIDETALNELYDGDEQEVRRLTRKIGRRLGVGDDAERVLQNSDLLGPHLERLTGAQLPRQPKKGGTSVTKDVLAQLRPLHSVVPLIETRKKAASRISNDWHPWTQLLDAQGDGRLHTMFRLWVAATGRTSAEGEAGHTFQQFLRGAGYRRIVRARKGWRIGSVDQSQIEMRIIAWLANERRMLDYFARDDDLHVAMAALVKALGEGATFEQYMADPGRWKRTVTDDERTAGKIPNFGLGFGGGPAVIQRNGRQDYGITFSDDEAQLAYDAYHLFYPDIAPWHESCWLFVDQGWVETPTHRIRSLRFAEGEDDEGRLRKAINTPVQNFATDLSLFCMVETVRALRREYGRHLPEVFEVLAFFHDAMQYHFDRREETAITAIVKREWEHPPLDRLGIDFPVPLRADVKVGRTWA